MTDPTARRPPSRLDAEGRRQVAPTWETLVERQIREAIDAGAFDDLPYRGERLPMEDDTAAGEMALGYRMLRNAGVAPPWVAADKEIRALLARRDDLLERAPRYGPLSRGRLRHELVELVRSANQAIGRLNAEAPTDRQHRGPLDERVELEALERSFAGDGGLSQPS